MYEIKVDHAKNRLYVKLAGVLGAAETKAVASKLLGEAKTMKPGFDLITDLSEFKPTADEAVAEISAAQVKLEQAGLRRAVRIVPRQSSVGMMQFTRATRESQVKFETATAATLADAEKLLGG